MSNRALCALSIALILLATPATACRLSLTTAPRPAVTGSLTATLALAQATRTPDPATETPTPSPPPSLPRVVGQGFSQQEGAKSAGWGIYLQNPNPVHAVQGATYRVTAYAQDGSEYASDEGRVSLLPGQTLGLGGTLRGPSGAPVDRIEVQIEGGKLVPAEVEAGFTFDHALYLPEHVGSCGVTSVIHSAHGVPVQDVQVSAVLRGPGGKIVGGGQGLLGFVPVGGSSGVLLRAPCAPEVTSVELYAALSDPAQLARGVEHPPDAQAVILHQYGYGRGEGQDPFGYGFVVENPNPNYAMDLLYQLSAYAANGTVLAFDLGDLVLLPGQTLGMADAFGAPEQTPVERIEVQVLEREVQPSGPFPPLAAKEVAYLADEGRVSGVIANPYPREVEFVRVTALAYDDAGRIVGSGVEIVNRIPANDRVRVWVRMFCAQDVASVTLYARLNTLSHYVGR